MKNLISKRQCAFGIALALCSLSMSLTPQVMAQGATTSSATIPVLNQTFDPVALYLTWKKDPTTTMTVRWQTVVGAAPGAIVTRLESRKIKSEAWLSHKAVALPMPHSNRITHEVEMIGLEPGTVYQFRFGP